MRDICSLIAILPLLSAATRIPLTKPKRLAGDNTVEYLQSDIANAMGKLERGFAAFETNTGTTHPNAFKKSRTKRFTGSIPLTNFHNISWHGSIEVGIPPKPFTTMFDSGSSDIFLPGPDCGTSCEGHAIFDPSKSFTSEDLNKRFNISYAGGASVAGEQYTDIVSIEPIYAVNQTVGVSDAYIGLEVANFPQDGLVGMAFPQISAYNATPLFHTLVAEGMVDEPVFGFKLSDNDAELLLGGVNESLVNGDFTYVPVTKEGFWQVTMDGISINGSQIVNASDSIIDTGTTLIIGDTQTVARLYDQIGGAQDAGNGVYTMDCNSTPTVSLTFGGREFAISPSTFIIATGDNTCAGGFGYSDDTEGLWTVGDVFLRNVYTAFDIGSSDGNSQVGFADLA